MCAYVGAAYAQSNPLNVELKGLLRDVHRIRIYIVRIIRHTRPLQGLCCFHVIRNLVMSNFLLFDLELDIFNSCNLPCFFSFSERYKDSKLCLGVTLCTIIIFAGLYTAGEVRTYAHVLNGVHLCLLW